MSYPPHPFTGRKSCSLPVVGCHFAITPLLLFEKSATGMGRYERSCLLSCTDRSGQKATLLQPAVSRLRRQSLLNIGLHLGPVSHHIPSTISPETAAHHTPSVISREATVHHIPSTISHETAAYHTLSAISRETTVHHIPSTISRKNVVLLAHRSRDAKADGEQE